MNLNDQYFDLCGLARYSKIGKSTLRDYIRRDGLPAFKIRGKVLIKQSEFDTWVNKFRISKKRDLSRLADEVIEEVKSAKQAGGQ